MSSWKKSSAITQSESVFCCRILKVDRESSFNKKVLLNVGLRTLRLWDVKCWKQTFF